MAHYRSRRTRRLLVVALTALVALSFATPASASQIITEEDGVIEAGEVIDDDVIFAGNTLLVDGVIKGDLVAVGSEITSNGTV